MYDIYVCVCVRERERSDNVLVRRCDETCVVKKCGINTFFKVIIHVILKCKVMT